MSDTPFIGTIRDTPEFNPQDPIEWLKAHPNSPKWLRDIVKSMTNNVDMINHPPHYTSHPSGIECIEVIRLCSLSMGNAIKYIWRYTEKNGMEDLKKAQWFLHDVVNNGGSNYLPYKARELLKTVVLAERNQLREILFNALIDCGASYALQLLISELDDIERDN